MGNSRLKLEEIEEAPNFVLHLSILGIEAREVLYNNRPSLFFYLKV